MTNVVEILKVPAVNGTVLAVTTLGDLSQVVTFLLLTATLFWTCIKIAKALKDFHRKD
jgi:hypothetical protein